MCAAGTGSVSAREAVRASPQRGSRAARGLDVELAGGAVGAVDEQLVLVAVGAPAGGLIRLVGALEADE